MNLIAKLITKLSGWKTIIGYVLLNLPFVTGNPMLKGAMQEVLNNPSSEVAWANLMAQAVLAVGIIHRVLKNLRW
jgi:hypothetical protein